VELPDRVDRSKPALALSGGGFRATLYHLGALTRLNELGYLPKLARISSVSGGSIASAMLAHAWPDLEFRDGVATRFAERVMQPLRKFCSRTIDVLAITQGAIHPTKSVGNITAEIYDELFGGMMLRDLPQEPDFVFNTTNIQTGRDLRFTRRYLADHMLGWIADPHYSVGEAVAASAAFPPVLSPVVLKVNQPWLQFSKGPAPLFGNTAYSKKLSLMDGGAYDNLGLETVDTFATILCSDAGAPFTYHENASVTWPAQALRALDIATDQARGLRKTELFLELRGTKRAIAFFGIDSENYRSSTHLKHNPKLTDKFARIRTRLDSFSNEEQGNLINWGWYQADRAMRSFIVRDAPAPRQWPIREWPLDRAVSKGPTLARRDHSLR
jgi:NTE family protein